MTRETGLPALVLALGRGLSMAAWAQRAGPDANGHGMVTLEACLAAFSDKGAGAHAGLDANDDGALDAAAPAAAREQGVLPDTLGR